MKIRYRALVKKVIVQDQLKIYFPEKIKCKLTEIADIF